jgi:hypothetical protein
LEDATEGGTAGGRFDDSLAAEEVNIAAFVFFVDEGRTRVFPTHL